MVLRRVSYAQLFAFESRPCYTTDALGRVAGSNPVRVGSTPTSVALASVARLDKARHYECRLMQVRVLPGVLAKE